VLSIAIGNIYGSLSPINCLILYVAQPVQHVLEVAFGKKFVCSGLTNGIFVYMAQAFESVLAAAFGKKLCWFESHYRHISLCSPGSWTRASSSLL